MPRPHHAKHPLTPALGLALLALACGCPGGGGGGGGNGTDDDGIVASADAESCMVCHNGSQHDDYAGPGLENPHPFSGAATLKCTACHGGDPKGTTAVTAHVPPPPEIGDEAFQEVNAKAYFNRLTLAGIDKLPDYEVGGKTYTGIDFLQFINPGDLRVVTKGRSCGVCHAPHAESVAQSLLATQAGMLAGAKFAIGDEVSVPGSAGLYEETASDLAWRAVTDPNFVFDPTAVGAVEAMEEFPVFSVHGGTDPDDIFNNPAYDALDLENDLAADGSVLPGSRLAKLYHEQVAFTCGDCHLGSAGANNRYGDFRSSGCTSCHMRYSLDGRSLSSDPNIRKLEPLDPDAIDEPERPHVRRHRIAGVARTLGNGEVLEGIDDYTCAGCHQGSNRTVMQYWGIRLDQNQDVRRGVQYPANPVTSRNTAQDERLFDPVVQNDTYNGRNANQYVLLEDYDGDGRDDTPADVHYEAGMGCIDCHGSHDLHGGKVGDETDVKLLSRMEQAVGITCESCHGTAEAYAPTAPGTTYDGTAAELALDREGHALRHVVKEADGSYILTSRLTGKRHYVPQTRDVIVDNGKLHPESGDPIFNVLASYAMGRHDGNAGSGLGPAQAGDVGPTGFSHMDNMSCASCHASWTNTCTGCHLKGEYDTGNNFSNITGERIVFEQANADFTYQTPVHFQIGVNAHNKVAPITSNTTVFFQYKDLNGVWSKTFAFSDRNGAGNNPGANGGNQHPALSHNLLMPHSIRGRPTATQEGARSCVACHLTTEGLTAFGPDYAAFRTAMATNDYAALNFNLLKQHIGQNTGNQLNSPLWVHMVAGLGSGLFLFDENGCPVNPLDQDANRFDCQGVAPAASFDLLNRPVRFDLDRIVEASGVSNSSSNHALLQPVQGPNLRDGAADPAMAGPLGATLIRRLTDPDAQDGIVLDAWIDANGQPQGAAPAILNPPPPGP